MSEGDKEKDIENKSVKDIIDKRRIETSIEVEASPNTVWNVLVNFDDYNEWNPQMRIKGKPEKGSRLKVSPGPEARWMPTFHSEIIHCSKYKLEWEGKLILPFIFSGIHTFYIKPLDNRNCIFKQSEKFSGILLKPILFLFGEQIKNGFKKMNRALKNQAEYIQNQK